MFSSSWPGLNHRPGQPAGEWIRASVPPTAALLAAVLGVLLLGSLPVSAQDLDLTELSLDELADLRVTTAAKREESLWETSSAVYVVTADDIRRLACRTIPEALRQVPGLNVAQIDAGTWAVSSRGGNGRFANKMLVMIDGRTIYSPLFSGVHWEHLSVNMDDIERIEVVRGPGGTIWGANAVNGVINIITRSADDTQGNLLAAGLGTADRGFGDFRAGMVAGDRLFYRVSAKLAGHRNSEAPIGADFSDDWRLASGALRVDWHRTPSSALTLAGDLRQGTHSRTYEMVTDVAPPWTDLVTTEAANRGWSLLGRWKTTFSAESDLTLQVTADRSVFDEVIEGLSSHTYDLDLQHHFLAGQRHEIVWGAGYRAYDDQVDTTFAFTFTHTTERNHLLSAFVQDEIGLLSDRLRFTLGTKFEHNSYTGAEWQPNIRLLWHPQDDFSMWGAASRAIRTPSRIERSGSMVLRAIPPGELDPMSPAAFILWRGSENYGSEELWAYELGGRARPTQRLYVDVAAFFNDYDKLRSGDDLPPEFNLSGPTPYLVVPLLLGNSYAGESYGIETLTSYQVSASWRLQLWYVFQKSHIWGPGIKPTEVAAWEQVAPENNVYLKSSWNLPWRTSLDLGLRWVDDVSFSGLAETPTALPTPSYLALDAAANWGVVPGVDLFLAGRNLTDDAHPEFHAEFLAAPQIVEIGRSVHGGLRWQF